MRVTACLPLLIAVCVAAAGWPGAAGAQAPAPLSSAPSTDAATRLQQLYTREWAWRQQEFAQEKIAGEWQSSDHMPSVTPAAWARRAAYWQQVLDTLDAIPAATLSHEAQVNAAVFRADVEALHNNVAWRTYEMPFNSDSFFWSYLNPQQPYQTEADWRRFIARLQDLPRYFDENIANMELGLARGWSVPRSSIEGRDRTLEPFTLAGEGNPFLATFDAIPPSIPAGVREQLRAQGRKVVLEQAVPAYRELLSYLREQYYPRTRTTTAASDLPDGAAFYQSQIREYVTRDMTPREIHDIGLANVERISAEMREVMQRAGFKGTFAEFLAFLRKDPQFYAKTPRELLATTAYVAKKIDGQLKYTVGKLPRYRFTIRAVPDDIAPNYTSGRGGLESCMFNTYDLPSRPLYNLPALVLHECSPGHSFQAALALEAPARPDFRQNIYFSGYGEGWGLYAEWLGTKMGIYETPYEDFGRLTFEMWRAARLVIDTGLHAYGWTRQQAIDYLASHTALAQLDVENEVDRYISWPGQALSYYIGYRTLRDLRTEAEQALGAGFDQKQFHDTILGLGAVPLPVLEQEVRAWIASRKPSGVAGACPPDGYDAARLARLKAAGFVVADPAAKQALARGLLACLGDPDPAVRDGIAYEALAQWMRAGDLDAAQLRTLRDGLYRLLDAPDADGYQAPFAALVLSEVARTDRIAPWMSAGERNAMVDRAATYVAGVTDYRGYDSVEGWRHGVAHGADWLMQLTLDPAVDKAQLRRLLDAVAVQVVPAQGHAYVFGEPERLARPVLFAARRGALDADAWKAWFASLPPKLGDRKADMSAWLARRHDLQAFLGVLYVEASRSDDAGVRQLLPGLTAALEAS